MFSRMEIGTVPPHDCEFVSSPTEFLLLNSQERVLDLIHMDICGPMKNITPGVVAT